MNERYTLYYVLGGLVNGSRDELAIAAGGGTVHLEDGHYFLLQDEASEWPDGHGPYDSVEEATEAAEERFASLQVWAIPIDDPDRPVWRLTDDNPDPPDANIVTIRRTAPGVWRAEIEGSYETLTLEMSCGGVGAILSVYRALLRASAPFQ